MSSTVTDDQADRLRRRLLISTSTFPATVGDGTARFILDLAVSLSDRFDVTVLAPHQPGALRLEVVDGVEVRRFRYFFPTSLQRLASGSGMSDRLATDWLARIQVPFFLIAQMVATFSTIRRTRPEVVNCHWLVPQGLTTAIVKRITRIPLVLHVHAADVYFLKRFWLGRRIARYVVYSSNAVLASGSHVRGSLDELVGEETKALLRPMGVWLKDFSMKASDSLAREVPADRSILFVGRLVEKKGVIYLLRAFVEVLEQIPDTKLRIIGSGPLEQSLIEAARSLGVGESVDFTGALPHEEVVKHMHRSVVACVPSIIDSKGETEGMPTVLLEAMASGIRVVGSDVDGIPDILTNRENGWLARPGDSEDLARALLDALGSADADLIAAKGRMTAANHDWSQVADEYRVVLDGVLG